LKYLVAKVITKTLELGTIDYLLQFFINFISTFNIRINRQLQRFTEVEVVSGRRLGIALNTMYKNV